MTESTNKILGISSLNEKWINSYRGLLTSNWVFNHFQRPPTPEPLKKRPESPLRQPLHLATPSTTVHTIPEPTQKRDSPVKPKLSKNQRKRLKRKYRRRTTVGQQITGQTSKPLEKQVVHIKSRIIYHKRRAQKETDLANKFQKESKEFCVDARPILTLLPIFNGNKFKINEALKSNIHWTNSKKHRNLAKTHIAQLLRAETAFKNLTQSMPPSMETIKGKDIQIKRKEF